MNWPLWGSPYVSKSSARGVVFWLLECPQTSSRPIQTQAAKARTPEKETFQVSTYVRCAADQTRLVSTHCALSAWKTRCRTRLTFIAGTAPRAGNAAERISCVSSHCADSAWKQAASRQRASPTTTRRIAATSPRSGWVRSAACVLIATTGSTPPMPRAHRSARTARLPTRTIRGTGQGKGVYSLGRVLINAQIAAGYALTGMSRPLLN